MVRKLYAAGTIAGMVAILYGFLLGGLFGANEAMFKDALHADADAALESVYGGDQAQAQKIVSKSWSYLKRSHLHGGAIGAAAVASSAALVAFGVQNLVGALGSVAFGLGGLLYAIFWLCAGFAAPSIGSTDLAKESFAFIALPGAGLSIIGVVSAIIALVMHTLGTQDSNEDT